MNTEKTYIYGRHAIIEAVSMRPDLVRILYLMEEISDTDLRAALKGGNTLPKIERIKKMPKAIPTDAVHQGYAAEVDAQGLLLPYEDFIRNCNITPSTAFALLGEVQDPHNVGAVIRSAAAFGISAVLIPEHRQAQVTGTVIKVSAGMAFRIPLVRIGNVNQTLEDLKKHGFWSYGLTGAATQSIHDEQFDRPSVFILGNEGAGIREKTLEHCDIPLRIPMTPGAESLNASVAAAVVFYAWSVQHNMQR